jgi:hypothetical protein
VGGFVLMHHFPSGFLERPKSALHAIVEMQNRGGDWASGI